MTKLTSNNQSYLYTEGKNDECYTYEYAVKPLVKYIPKNWTVWCPFDTEESAFVKVLKENGYKVIHSHISEGKDFFRWEPEEHWDCIVSNPCFTGKRQVFERALSFGKPFALIMTMTWLNDTTVYKLWEEKGKELQLMCFDNRMHFHNGGKDMGRPTFSSSYFCWNFLPKQLVFERLAV